jgi:hypothetical protein
LEVEGDLFRKLRVSGKHHGKVVLEITQDLAQAITELAQERRMTFLHASLQLYQDGHNVLTHVSLQDAAKHTPSCIGGCLVASGALCITFVITGFRGRKTNTHLLTAQQRQPVSQCLASWLLHGLRQLHLPFRVGKRCQQSCHKLCTDVKFLLIRHQTQHKTINHDSPRRRPLQRETVIACRALEVCEASPTIERTDYIE